MTDRQTDGRTSCDSIALCIALGDKKVCCLTAGYPGLLAPHMMHGVPPELMAAGVLGPGLLPYARPQLVSTFTLMTVLFIFPYSSERHCARAEHKRDVRIGGSRMTVLDMT